MLNAHHGELLGRKMKLPNREPNAWSFVTNQMHKHQTKPNKTAPPTIPNEKFTTSNPLHSICTTQTALAGLVLMHHSSAIQRCVKTSTQTRAHPCKIQIKVEAATEWEGQRRRKRSVEDTLAISCTDTINLRSSVRWLILWLCLVCSWPLLPQYLNMQWLLLIFVWTLELRHLLLLLYLFDMCICMYYYCCRCRCPLCWFFLFSLCFMLHFFSSLSFCRIHSHSLSSSPVIR